MSEKLTLKKGIRHLSWKEVGILCRDSVVEFFKEKSFFHGAALSYYAIFAMVPTLYLAITLFGKFVGQKTMIEIIGKLLKEQIGIKDISGIISFLSEMNMEKGNFFLDIAGVVALIISSTALLISLKGSLNDFFDVEKVYDTKKKMILDTLYSRFLSMIMLVIFGVIVIIIYFAQTILMSIGTKVFGHIKAIDWVLVEFAEHGLAILSNVIIFTLIFRYLHDGVVKWKLASAGGIVTGILLYFGQILIKSYLTHYFFAKDGSIAGTFLVILLWTYYSSQIIFLGAKFTAVYAKMVGQEIIVRD